LSPFSVLTPSGATQLITFSPHGIALDRWREMFLATATHDDAKIYPKKIKAWNTFGDFLEGKISAKKYYSEKSGICDTVGIIADTLGSKKFDEYRRDLNALLSARIRVNRYGQNWKEISNLPDERMYLDIAQLLNRGLIQQMGEWGVHRYPKIKCEENGRHSRAAELTVAILEGFDEALLSAPATLSNGFIFNVTRKRILDFYRVKVGRTYPRKEWESAEQTPIGHRPRFHSLDEIFANTTICLYDSLAAPQQDEMFALEAVDLVKRVRKFAHSLPSQERLVFETYLNEKGKDPEIEDGEIAEKIGLRVNNFRMHLSHGRQKLIKSHPEIADEVTRLFGHAPLLVERGR
jgi:hypothetical protein